MTLGQARAIAEALNESNMSRMQMKQTRGELEENYPEFVWQISLGWKIVVKEKGDK